MSKANQALVISNRGEVCEVESVNVPPTWAESYLAGFRSASEGADAEFLPHSEALVRFANSPFISHDGKLFDKHLGSSADLSDEVLANAKGEAKAIEMLFTELCGYEDVSILVDRDPDNRIRYFVGLECDPFGDCGQLTPEIVLDAFRAKIAEIAEALAESRE